MPQRLHSLAGEFETFILRGNIIALAVAFVVGAAVKDVIFALVESLASPLIAAIFGEPDFAALTFAINDSVFRYGEFINAMLSFFLIAAAVFFIIVRPVNRLVERGAIQQEDDGSSLTFSTSPYMLLLLGRDDDQKTFNDFSSTAMC